MADKYVIFHIDGGAGKSIMATAVCESIKAAYPEHKIIVVTAWPEVFLHNSTVYRVYKAGHFGYFYEDYIKNKDSIILRADPYHHQDFINKKGHLTDIWCKLIGIPSVTKVPKIILTQRELMQATKTINKQGALMITQISGGADGQEVNYSWARDIPVNFAQRIVDASRSKFEKVLHVRRENQPALNNTIQVTDNLRNLFCYVAMADKLVLIDSLLQHVAAAFNKQAAVAWIGNSPDMFGYDIHKNILPSQAPAFRHMVDSYLEDFDWIGRRLYECPYDDIDNIFSEKPFLDYLDTSVVNFNKMP